MSSPTFELRDPNRNIRRGMRFEYPMIVDTWLERLALTPLHTRIERTINELYGPIDATTCSDAPVRTGLLFARSGFRAGAALAVQAAHESMPMVASQVLEKAAHVEMAHDPIHLTDPTQQRALADTIVRDALAAHPRLDMLTTRLATYHASTADKNGSIHRQVEPFEAVRSGAGYTAALLCVAHSIVESQRDMG